MPWSALELQRVVDSERSGTSAVSTVHAKTVPSARHALLW